MSLLLLVEQAHIAPLEVQATPHQALPPPDLPAPPLAHPGQRIKKELKLCM
jgi:hypothetical protein